MAMRFLVAGVLLLAACAPAAVSSSPSPSPVATAASTPSIAPTASAPPTTPVPTATPVSSRTPTSLPTFVDLWAPSANVVWALVAGDSLFRSIDRGDTWQQRSIPAHKVPNGLTMSFSSERDGWGTVFFAPGTGCTFEEIELRHTIDGAVTWETLAWERLAAAGIADFQCKGEAVFADDQRGILVAYDSNSLPTVYRTADGGRSWTGIRLADPPGFKTQGGGVFLRPGRPRWFGATVLMPVLGYVGGTVNSYVYRSLDGGATWSFLANIPASGVAFVTETRWLRFVLPLEETTDSGATWHSFGSDYSQAAGVVPYAAFADASVGYATVRGSIQRTVDGGAHWTAIKTPGT
jgi:photosystem II stability/assembly factor-like uncharacterized protein